MRAFNFTDEEKKTLLGDGEGVDQGIRPALRAGLQRFRHLHGGRLCLCSPKEKGEENTGALGTGKAESQGLYPGEAK